MTREVRTSSRVNTAMLDRALSDASGAGELYIKQGEAIADRVAAEGRGIENLGLGKRNFQTAYGDGLKIGLISVGVGLAALLVLVGASYVIEALRKPYSTAAVEALVSENAALLERVRKLSVLAAEPATKAETSVTDPKVEATVSALDQGDIGLSTAALPLDPNSTNCPENRSYSVQCVGDHKYDDGRSYSGQWRNGLPDGQGSFTMTNGSVLEATWKAGFPLQVENQMQVKKALKTVTVFKTLPNYDLANKIFDVVAGHRFADGNSEEWSLAYCYANVGSKDGLSSQINLSRYDKPGGPLIKEVYASNISSLISAATFKRAQSDCPYQFAKFSE
jgi:hypothetical protein